MKQVTEKPEVLEGVRELLGVNESYLEWTAEMIRTNYISINRYMEQVLNLDEEKRGRLKELYTFEACTGVP